MQGLVLRENERPVPAQPLNNTDQWTESLAHHGQNARTKDTRRTHTQETTGGPLLVRRRCRLALPTPECSAAGPSQQVSSAGAGAARAYARRPALESGTRRTAGGGRDEKGATVRYRSSARKRKECACANHLGAVQCAA